MKRAGERLRRIAGAALATATVALVSVLAPSAPAGAATAPTGPASTVGGPATVAVSGDVTVLGSCPFSNTLCLFENAGWTGEVFTVQALNPTTGACVNLVSHGWEARAHSAINTNPRPARLYTNVDCTGSSYTISGSPPSFTFAAKSVFVY